MFKNLGDILINLGRYGRLIGGLTTTRIVSFWVFVVVTSLVSIFANAEETKLQTRKNESLAINAEATPMSVYFGEENYDIGTDFYYEETGRSSWYGKRFHHRKTSSGERYDMYAYTAAHRTLPFGTIVRVTNLENNQSVLVRINDRGPFVRKRIIDLSSTAVKDIDAFSSDMVKVETMLASSPDARRVQQAQNFFVGYSFDRPLVCLPQSTLQFVDTAYSFGQAIEQYKELLSSFKKDLYLMVPFSSITKENSKNDDEIYFIAVYSPYDDKFIHASDENANR